MAVALAAVYVMAAAGDRRGGRGFESGRGHGGRVNDCGRRGDRIPSSTTYRLENCPDQDAIDRVKPNIASDMTVYNVRLHAVNGVLVRAVPRSEGG